MELKQRLLELADPEYQVFQSKLIPGVKNFLGVRSPEMKKLAKEVARGDWRQFLDTGTDDSYEEISLQGLVIGFAKMPFAERLEWIRKFIPKINNWAICDGFVASLKAAKKELPAFHAFLLPYLASEKTYDVRFAVVSLMTYYTGAEYLTETIQLLDGVSHPDYYVKMGVAWALSLCFIRDSEQTMAYLKGGHHLDADTYRKTLQKIVESNRVGAETKAEIRAMRKRITN